MMAQIKRMILGLTGMSLHNGICKMRLPNELHIMTAKCSHIGLVQQWHYLPNSELGRKALDDAK